MKTNSFELYILFNYNKEKSGFATDFSCLHCEIFADKIISSKDPRCRFLEFAQVSDC